MHSESHRVNFKIRLGLIPPPLSSPDQKESGMLPKHMLGYPAQNSGSGSGSGYGSGSGRGSGSG
jgi:hypothetical protein